MTWKMSYRERTLIYHNNDLIRYFPHWEEALLADKISAMAPIGAGERCPNWQERGQRERR